MIGLLQSCLTVGALLCGGAAAFVGLSAFLPSPNPRFAALALAGGDGSLLFGALGLAGAALAVAALALGGGWPSWVGLGLGVLAIGLALVPPIQASATARAHGVSLGPRLDLLGRRDGPTGPPAQMIHFAETGGQALRLAAYPAASSRSEPAPAIVVVHGGGWGAGEIRDVEQWSYWLAGQGFAVFDVEYRLAPQPNWQTATGDVKCAVGWVKRHAAEHSADPDRVVLLGRSAGAHLALLAAYTPDASGLPPSCEALDTTVRAVVSFYAPTDLAWGYDHPSNRRVFDGVGALEAFLGGDPRSAPDAYALASPTTHVGPRTPPTLLVHGGRDQYVRLEQMDHLAERLRAADVPHRAVAIPHAQHAFDHLWNGWAAQLTRPILLDFLRAHTR
jgi:acetyl esterase/lipase